MERRLYPAAGGRAVCGTIERTQDRFALDPEWLAADTAYGSVEMPGWLPAHGS